MKKQEKNANELFEELLVRYPALMVCRDSIARAYEAIKKSYCAGGKLLVAGNGGSAADSEHIVGELMKSFLFDRRIDRSVFDALTGEYGQAGWQLARKLEGTLPAVPLTSMPALSTAFANDSDAAVDFAQKLYGYGTSGDIFLGITTSGNSKNILYALMVAHAKGIKSIVLTGETGGKCRGLGDIVICVPERETSKIQEYHLPVYHALCAMLEADLFEEKTDNERIEL